jgi:hypothetical protein
LTSRSGAAVVAGTAVVAAAADVVRGAAAVVGVVATLAPFAAVVGATLVEAVVFADPPHAVKAATSPMATTRAAKRRRVTVANVRTPL